MSWPQAAEYNMITNKQTAQLLQEISHHIRSSLHNEYRCSLINCNFNLGSRFRSISPHVQRSQLFRFIQKTSISNLDQTRRRNNSNRHSPWPYQHIAKINNLTSESPLYTYFSIIIALDQPARPHRLYNYVPTRQMSNHYRINLNRPYRQTNRRSLLFPTSRAA
jgi:hypothetical protein